ncbi:hypothetical protein J8273_7069 [Carpediemonas membranifera]|uniref:Uncharacterized protein n=1 Tax=Carpediemonas membranifera TaxID=201153 RepID=A0A8J6AT48_9EUKA|nr:hypothetical protein J8273_7069 [Carpediemonas membranifera]|eukprot:KAG9390810.1 hypothetical protein J8273_7069 [Carpediemonas membranifera]
MERSSGVSTQQPSGAAGPGIIWDSQGSVTKVMFSSQDKDSCSFAQETQFSKHLQEAVKDKFRHDGDDVKAKVFVLGQKEMQNFIRSGMPVLTERSDSMFCSNSFDTIGKVLKVGTLFATANSKADVVVAVELPKLRFGYFVHLCELKVSKSSNTNPDRNACFQAALYTAHLTECTLRAVHSQFPEKAADSKFPPALLSNSTVCVCHPDYAITFDMEAVTDLGVFAIPSSEIRDNVHRIRRDVSDSTAMLDELFPAVVCNAKALATELSANTPSTPWTRFFPEILHSFVHAENPAENPTEEFVMTSNSFIYIANESVWKIDRAHFCPGAMPHLARNQRLGVAALTAVAGFVGKFSYELFFVVRRDGRLSAFRPPGSDPYGNHVCLKQPNLSKEYLIGPAAALRLKELLKQPKRVREFMECMRSHLFKVFDFDKKKYCFLHRDARVPNIAVRKDLADTSKPMFLVFDWDFAWVEQLDEMKESLISDIMAENPCHTFLICSLFGQFKQLKDSLDHHGIVIHELNTLVTDLGKSKDKREHFFNTLCGPPSSSDKRCRDE